eukprot:758328-Hanusia_phi.AAC.8
MNAKLAEIEQDRSEIFQKLSESIYREHQALRQLDEVKHREGVALEELERLRNEVQESRSTGESRTAEVRTCQEGLGASGEALLQVQLRVQEMSLLKSSSTALARSISEEIRLIREDLQKSAALWALPNEKLLEERARNRDQIMRLEGQISEHTRQMLQVDARAEQEAVIDRVLQVTQDYEERLRRAEGQRARRGWAQDWNKAEVPEKAKPTDKPTDKSTDKPTVKSTDKPTVKSTDKSSVKSTVKSTVKDTSSNKKDKVEGKASPLRMRAAMSPARTPKPVKSDSDSDSDESRLARRMKRVSAANKAEATRREQVRQVVDEESNDEDDYVRSSRVRLTREGTPARSLEERGRAKEEMVNGRPSLGSSFLAAMEIESRMLGR